MYIYKVVNTDVYYSTECSSVEAKIHIAHPRPPTASAPSVTPSRRQDIHNVCSLLVAVSFRIRSDNSNSFELQCSRAKSLAGFLNHQIITLVIN